MISLFQIDGGHFCAGAVFNDNVCIHAAPIIRWLVGKSLKFTNEYAVQKGWKLARSSGCQSARLISDGSQVGILPGQPILTNMPRQTSIQAYREIQASGFLGELTWAVYDCVYEHGPMTQSECWKQLGWDKKDSIGPRFSELVRYGVFQELPKRKCRITGRQCIDYDVTAYIPIEKIRAEQQPLIWVALDEVTGEGYANRLEEPLRAFCAPYPSLKIFRARGLPRS